MLNILDSLPALPASLDTIYFNDNKLTSLPTSLPDSLRFLEVKGNVLTSLPALPNGLLFLECYSNKLNGLPALPPGLLYLSTTNNYRLKNLPNLPSSLTFLDCGDDSLSELPPLPPSLNGLYCEGNNLKNLPALPVSLSVLVCGGNPLVSLPDLPPVLFTFEVSGDTGLKCMPCLRKFTGGLDEFSIEGTGIKCLPCYINHPTAVTIIDSYPICDSTFNPNNCPIDNGSCSARFALYPDTTTPHHWYALNQSYGKGPLVYSWSWGDNTFSTGANPSHTYPNAGLYTICLEITDDTSCISSFCDQEANIYRLENDNTIISIDVVNALPTALKQISNPVESVGIFPNPASGELNLSFGQNDFADGKIVISDIIGRVLKVQSKSDMETQMTINLSDWANGIYFIHFHSANEDLVQKIVKE